MTGQIIKLVLIWIGLVITVYVILELIDRKW